MPATGTASGSAIRLRLFHIFSMDPMGNSPLVYTLNANRSMVM